MCAPPRGAAEVVEMARGNREAGRTVENDDNRRDSAREANGNRTGEIMSKWQTSFFLHDALADVTLVRVRELCLEGLGWLAGSRTVRFALIALRPVMQCMVLGGERVVYARHRVVTLGGHPNGDGDVEGNEEERRRVKVLLAQK